MSSRWFLLPGLPLVAWGLLALAVPILDIAKGMPGDRWTDFVYAAAFVLAGAALLGAALAQYRGGWPFVVGVLAMHFGIFEMALRRLDALPFLLTGVVLLIAAQRRHRNTGEGGSPAADRGGRQGASSLSADSARSDP